MVERDGQRTFSTKDMLSILLTKRREGEVPGTQLEDPTRPPIPPRSSSKDLPLGRLLCSGLKLPCTPNGLAYASSNLNSFRILLTSPDRTNGRSHLRPILRFKHSISIQHHHPRNQNASRRSCPPRKNRSCNPHRPFTRRSHALADRRQVPQARQSHHQY